MTMASDIIDAARPPKWIDSVGAFTICVLTVIFAIISIGPYFGISPTGVDGTIAANQNAVVNNLFIAVMSFFVGGSVASRKKDESLNTAVNTAAKAQEALAPIVTAAMPAVDDKTVELKPGQTATVNATEDPANTTKDNP